MLAAFGLQALLDAAVPQRVRVAVPLGALLIAGVGLLMAGAKGDDLHDTVTHFLRGIDVPGGGVLALTSIAWYLL